MYQHKNITPDLYWIGGNDRRLALFESAFPIPRGVSYNSYFLDDEKTVVLDTVDKAVSDVFFENIENLLAGRKLDYVVINHMEPDHAATLGTLVEKYPEVQVVCNAKIIAMIKQYFNFDIDSRAVVVKEGDFLPTGKHNLTFVMAPMVHWPEVMVTYDTVDKILFSADAFGTFGALSGNIFADQYDFKKDWLDDARRYYTNIVGKYGPQVQNVLKKASALEISYICPLHGPIWRKNIEWFIEKHARWSSYTPEDNAVMIAYSSVYGNTENAAAILAGALSDKGVANIVMYDVSVTHPSVIVSEAFRCSHIVFATTTYNAGIFISMENVIMDIVAHNLQNRTVAIIENGSWAATAASLVKKELEKLKNITVLDGTVTVKSSVKEEQRVQLLALADSIVDSMPKATPMCEELVDPNAMFKISYGLYVLTAKNENKDNGCIINAVLQVTDTPKQIVITVNKGNYTHDMIMESGEFNLSILNNDAKYKVFEQFGFSSGKDTDKFADCDTVARSENGLIYLTQGVNTVISGKVIDTKDLGTHTQFLATVEEAKIINGVPSATYQYYFDNIKPKPIPVGEKKTGYVCKICGYVHEGDVLPDDIICPLCKHGAEAFEKIV